jgi:hypothetical protein
MITPERVALKDVLQHGPNRYRNISGICSTCGDFLLARLDDPKPNTERLRAALEQVFEQHIAACHPDEAALPQHGNDSEIPVERA